MIKANGWLESAARAGYLAKGIVYVLIGILAAMWAFGEGGQVSGGEGVVAMLAGQPGGTVILALLGLGLIGYAVWRFVQAVTDPGSRGGSDTPGLAKRIGWGASGVIYLFLSFTCFQAIGLASSGGGGGKKTWLAKLFTVPGGEYIAIAIGIAVIGSGFYQLYKAYTAKFTKHLKMNQMSTTQRTWTVRLGRIGYTARGIVLPIIGFFLIKAGMASSAAQAKGVGGALREVSQQTYGMILLALIAIGLAAYGVYQVASSRYRRIPV